MAIVAFGIAKEAIWICVSSGRNGLNNIAINQLNNS